MKRLLFILIAGAIASCSTNRYLLADEGSDQHYLANYISDYKKKGRLTAEPLIVVDGVAWEYDDLKSERLPLRKDDIAGIECLDKGSNEAKIIYGEKGKNGVLIITTKQAQENIATRLNGDKVLLMIGDRRVSQEEIYKLDPNDIESVEVIKDKERIKTFSSGDYDGVVIIKLKTGSRKTNR